MSLKIRKLYNVLVVGGLLAACEKPHTQAREPQPPTLPAKVAAPVEAAKPPVAPEQMQSPPDKAAEPAPQVASEPPPEPAKQTAPKKRRAPAKAKTVPAEEPVGTGGGVRGWH